MPQVKLSTTGTVMNKPKQEHVTAANFVDETEVQPKTDTTEGGMELATVWVKINELGSNIRLLNVTPAEVTIVNDQFGLRTADDPTPISAITHLEITGKTNRGTRAEFARLAKKYGGKQAKDAFPGNTPQIPLTFAQVGVKETTEELQPKAGQPTQVIELAKLPKEDTTDAESVAEIEQRKAQSAAMEEQGKQIAALAATVTALTAHLVSKEAPKAS